MLRASLVVVARSPSIGSVDASNGKHATDDNMTPSTFRSWRCIKMECLIEVSIDFDSQRTKQDTLLLFRIHIIMGFQIGAQFLKK